MVPSQAEKADFFLDIANQTACRPTNLQRRLAVSRAYCSASLSVGMDGTTQEAVEIFSKLQNHLGSLVHCSLEAIDVSGLQAKKQPPAHLAS